MSDKLVCMYLSDDAMVMIRSDSHL